MDGLKLDDFTKYHFLSGVRFAPDGTSAAFIDKISNVRENGYDSCIRLIRLPEMTVTRLTTGGKEDRFLYDDSDTILFPASRTPEDQPQPHHQKTVFYRIGLRGGEALRAFSLPWDVMRLERLREHLYLFIARTDVNRPDPTNAAEYVLDDYADYHVLTELPYWANGAGFVSGIRHTLGIYDETTDHCTLLTEPLFDTDEIAFTGERIVYTGRSYDELRSERAGLYQYDINSGKTQIIVEPDILEIRSLACDAKGFWFLASDRKRFGSSQTCDLWYYDGEIHLRNDAMPAVGVMPTTDSTLGDGTPFFTRDNRLYFRALVDFQTLLYSTDHGALRQELSFDGPVLSFDVNSRQVLFVSMLPGRLQELYLADRTTGRIQPVTHLNEAVLNDKYIGECRYIPFTDSDGVRIDGWIIPPRDFDPARTWPGILNIHGGPRAAFGPCFFHEMQYWAGQGYFVFFCNPRGSEGRGDAFGDLRGKWGTVDYRDLMEFVDHVLEITPALDRNRLGVTGGSYGGWMTNWIIGHTGRFAAAASQRSFSNWLSDFGCSEIGFTYDVSEVGATPWEDPQTLWERSPVRYANQVTTPTLFIHSLQDYNCPFSEGMQMFAGLKYHHVPSRVCAIEGENHSLSRSGKPRHRIRRLAEITDWMNQWLK